MSRISRELRRVEEGRLGDANTVVSLGFAQDGLEATFHIDPIKPKVVGGETVAEGLACCFERALGGTLSIP